MSWMLGCLGVGMCRCMDVTTAPLFFSFPVVLVMEFKTFVFDIKAFTPSAPKD